MLDAKALRENFDEIKALHDRRGKDYELEKFVNMDKERRNLIQEVEVLKAEQNTKSKAIPQLKKDGVDVSETLKEMKELSEKVKELDVKVKQIDNDIVDFLLRIPNVPNKLVPQGDSDQENLELRKHLEPTKFDFEPKAHWDIGKDLDILDPETAAKITGSRFHVYKGLGARLERALYNFMLNTHTGSHGYTEIMPPIMVNRDSMTGTGNLPKFEDDAFKVANTDYFLVPTAEVPVTNIHRDEILDGDRLPISYCAYTPCFRSEVGSAGRDTRGVIRQHQFNKVELVKFVKPETSYDELENLTGHAENILKLLGLPYRVVRLCTGDLGFTSAMTYDIEVWMPSYDRYVEISSCSNFEGYQARRANIKYKNDKKDKAQHVHTLNGSGLAVGRTTAAILENFQNEDGTVTIPEVLLPYMCGATKLEKTN
ncbi:MAG: serine--tRNA ligase [Lachnospirales bacterium]